MLYTKPKVQILDLSCDDIITAAGKEVSENKLSNFSYYKKATDIRFFPVFHIKCSIKCGLSERLFIVPINSKAPDYRKSLCLSDVSMLVWNLLAAGQSESQIIDAVSSECSIEKSLIEDDIRSFLVELEKNGFLLVADE